MYRVLLIDDEEVILEGLQKMIHWKELDCKIVGKAEDGEVGLKLIESLQPDIILTDIRMPKISGLKMISMMRNIKSDSKIIILTGFRDFDYAQEAIKLGVFRFLLKPSRRQEIISVIQEAIREINATRTKEKDYMNLRAKVKTLYGLEEIQPIRKEDISPQGNNKLRYLVEQAIDYMQIHYSTNIDLQMLADELFISTWHLSKLLKKETGSNFVDILNGIRINAARELLTATNYKIYEIAEKVGYTDIAYFSRMFKKLTKLTPSQYRNKMH